ncbi:MAG: 6-carboxytetrahydropterin synthase QueD [Acidobacteria bacterium]|nr:6-carboxytetrahydropterin synthase QueD [Acidobacteriota bacterium]
MYSVRVETRFSSSHYLTGYEGNCSRLHGHNWRVVVEIAGMKLNKTGMLVDFIRLKGKLDEIAGKLDHIVLNEHPYFQSTDINPTAENLAAFFYSRLQNSFTGTRVLRVEVYETDDYVAAYIPDK